ncbi:MAG: hypothetical protein DPW16_00250 [Chloroflexi bacterium]|nr:hypothetical protein [Chloroflexota bacterium]
MRPGSIEQENNRVDFKYILQVVAILLLIALVVFLVFMWELEPENDGNKLAPIATQRALTNEAIEHLLTETPVP